VSSDLERLTKQMEKLGISHGDVARSIGRSVSTIQKQLSGVSPLKQYVLEAVEAAIQQRLAERDGTIVEEPQARSSVPQSAFEAAVAETLKELGGTVVFSPLMRTTTGRPYRPDILYRTPGPDPEEFAIEIKANPREAMLADLEAQLRSVETVELLLKRYDLKDVGELKAAILRQRDKVKQHRSVLDPDGDEVGAEKLDGGGGGDAGHAARSGEPVVRGGGKKRTKEVADEETGRAGRDN